MKEMELRNYILNIQYELMKKMEDKIMGMSDFDVLKIINWHQGRCWHPMEDLDEMLEDYSPVEILEMGGRSNFDLSEEIFDIECDEIRTSSIGDELFDLRKIVKDIVDNLESEFLPKLNDGEDIYGMARIIASLDFNGDHLTHRIIARDKAANKGIIFKGSEEECDEVLKLFEDKDILILRGYEDNEDEVIKNDDLTFEIEENVEKYVVFFKGNEIANIYAKNEEDALIMARNSISIKSQNAIESKFVIDD